MATVRELTPDDAPALTRLYEDYDWWADREEPNVRRALAETDLAIGIEIEGELVAAARVLTDFLYYTMVYDVIVAEDHRGNGLGEQLFEAIKTHPAMESARRMALLCREGLVPFYESVGFERYDPTVEVPTGGTEDLVRMYMEFSDE